MLEVEFNDRQLVLLDSLAGGPPTKSLRHQRETLFLRKNHHCSKLLKERRYYNTISSCLLMIGRVAEPKQAIDGLADVDRFKTHMLPQGVSDDVLYKGEAKLPTFL